MKEWRRLGEILVSEGFLTETAVAEAIANADAGTRIGEHLVRAGLLSETQLAQALAHQLSLPWVSIVHVDFRSEILERIPAEMASRLRIIPVYLQQAPGQDPVLFVATSDPTNEDAIAEASKHAKMPVRMYVAAQGDLLTAIRFHYGAAAERDSLRPKADGKKVDAKAAAYASKQQAPPLPMRAKMPSITSEAMLPRKSEDEPPRESVKEPEKEAPKELAQEEGPKRIASVEVELDFGASGPPKAGDPTPSDS